MKLICAALPLLLATLAFSQTTRPGEGESIGNKPVVVGYAPNWVDTVAFAKAFPWEQVTQINIAFENPVDEAGNVSWSPANDALIAGAKAHGVKVLLSIGGGAASGDKKLLALNAKLLDAPRRNAFAKKLAELCLAKGLDGLDVDIEGPAIIPAYPGFIEALAAELKSHGLLLTAALSQGYGGANVPPETLRKFDLVHIMAYDGTGYWEPAKAGQHSSMEMAQANVAYFESRGLPASHITLGLPFYGYGFGKAFKKRDYPYKDILAAYPGAEGSDVIGETIYYNGLATIRAKTAWAMKEGLAGVMIWSLDLDVPGEKSLLNAVHETIEQAPRAGSEAAPTTRTAR